MVRLILIGSTQFACAILSDTLLYYFRTNIVIRKKTFGTDKKLVLMEKCSKFRAVFVAEFCIVRSRETIMSKLDCPF